MKTTNNTIQEKLSLADQEEFKKCQESPLYFYNNYVRKEGQKELTEEEYQKLVQLWNENRYRRTKKRNPLPERPVMPKDCFKPRKKPFFISIKHKNNCLYSRRNSYTGKVIFGYSVVIRIFGIDLL